MKKTKLSVLLLLVALVSSLSAEAKVLGLGIGPKAGVTLNKFHMSESVLDSDNRCGFTGGLTAEYIAPALGLGADISVMFTHMETEVEQSMMGVTVTDKLYGNFIEVPIHLKYKISIPAVSSIISPYVFTGPNLAFKISSKDSFGDTKETQFGWDLGLGVELIKHLQIGAGYTFGINNIARHISVMDENFNITEVKVKNNYWTITAAWLF